MPSLSLVHGPRDSPNRRSHQMRACVSPWSMHDAAHLTSDEFVLPLIYTEYARPHAAADETVG